MSRSVGCELGPTSAESFSDGSDFNRNAALSHKGRISQSTIGMTWLPGSSWSTAPQERGVMLRLPSQLNNAIGGTRCAS